jgi:hypothetical protein
MNLCFLFWGKLSQIDAPKNLFVGTCYSQLDQLRKDLEVRSECQTRDYRGFSRIGKRQTFFDNIVDLLR